MKCPYRKVIASEFPNTEDVIKVVREEFNDCDMFECPMWDSEIGKTGGCKRVEAEIRGLSPYSYSFNSDGMTIKRGL